MLAAFCKFKGKCTNCRKFGHKSTKCHSKLRNSKGEGTESEKAKSKRVQIRAQSSALPAAKWDNTSQNVPSLSLKRVLENKQRRSPTLY